MNGEVVKTLIFPGVIGAGKTTTFAFDLKIYNNLIYLSMWDPSGGGRYWIDCYDMNFNLINTSEDFSWPPSLTGSATYIAGYRGPSTPNTSVKILTRSLEKFANFDITPPPNVQIFYGSLGLVGNKYYHWWAFSAENGKIPITPYYVNGEVAGDPFFLQQTFERDWPFYMGGLIAHNVVL